MAFSESYHCDVCSKAKGATETWWLSWVDCYSAHDGAQDQSLLKFTRWEPVLAHSADVKHLCGARCAGTLMDRWMTELHENPEAKCDTA